MNPVHGPAASGRLDAPAPRDARADLRKLANDLQAVFLNQLFQAMRESVPEDEGLGTDPGRQLYTQLFDERVATEASKHMEHGIADALYRQLAPRLPAAESTETP
jgi:flagellar protein FlgJ